MSIKKYIPDFITSLNLASGTLGVVFALQGRIDAAFPLMLAGALFDFCDGLAARALGAYSDLGKELDSLSDLVTFGVLPAVMLHNLMKVCSWSASWLCYIPLLLAVFTGIRLAKFNVDTRQGHSFLGLASPVSALLCASMAFFVASQPATFVSTLCAASWFIPVLTVCLCALLVCEIPMFSLKFAKEDSKTLTFKRVSLGIEALIAVAVVLILGWNWSLAATLVCLIYILKNIAYALFKL